jgi:protein-disulfide isomerase
MNRFGAIAILFALTSCFEKNDASKDSDQEKIKHEKLDQKEIKHETKNDSGKDDSSSEDHVKRDESSVDAAKSPSSSEDHVKRDESSVDAAKLPSSSEDHVKRDESSVDAAKSPSSSDAPKTALPSSSGALDDSKNTNSVKSNTPPKDTLESSEKSAKSADVSNDQSDPRASDHKDHLENQGDLFKISQDDVVMGNKDASVIIIEYSSPSCPHCAYYHENVFDKVKKEYIDTGKIAYVLRNFIWTKQDLDGAILSLCDREKFAPFSNILYSQQKSWAFSKNYREILTNIAQLGGVSPEQYATCLNDQKISEQLLEQTKLFSQVMKKERIAGTPAFIINGHVMDQAHSFQNLSAEIEKRLIKK